MLDEIIKDYIVKLEEKKNKLNDELTTEMNNYKNDNRLKEKNFFQKLLLTISGKKKDFESQKEMIIKEHEEKIKLLEDEIKKVEDNIIQMQDDDTIVYTLYKERPELFNNPKFVISLIYKNPKYIIYDLSNDEKVFETFINMVYDAFNDKMSLDAKILHTEFYHELYFPKEPEAGKYKIPHRFLFEAIKSNLISDIAIHNVSVKEALINTFFVYQQYRYHDCKYSQDYGKKLEELYLDDSIDLYYAGINEPTSAFKEGYQVNYGADLSRNFWDAHGCGYSFLSIISPGAYGRPYKIFAAIPKDAKRTIGSDGKPGFYTDDNRNVERSYLLPEYIIGATYEKDGEAIFAENPFKNEEQRKYKNYGNAGKGFFVDFDEALSKLNNSAKSR